jgi:hypothetical protein
MASAGTIHPICQAQPCHAVLPHLLRLQDKLQQKAAILKLSVRARKSVDVFHVLIDMDVNGVMRVRAYQLS